MVDDGRTTDGRTTDGRTPDHGHPISSPCEPDGSGELIKHLTDHSCAECVCDMFRPSNLFNPYLANGFSHDYHLVSF